MSAAWYRFLRSCPTSHKLGRRRCRCYMKSYAVICEETRIIFLQNHVNMEGKASPDSRGIASPQMRTGYLSRVQLKDVSGNLYSGSMIILKGDLHQNGIAKIIVKVQELFAGDPFSKAKDNVDRSLSNSEASRHTRIEIASLLRSPSLGFVDFRLARNSLTFLRIFLTRFISAVPPLMYFVMLRPG